MKGHRHAVRQFFRSVLASLGLVFLPVPIGFLKRQLAGKYDQHGILEFYSHPNLVCTMHLIWVGWLVTFGALYDHFAIARGWPQLPARDLSWPWLSVLVITIVIMGIQFGRVPLGFLVAAVAIGGLALTLIQSLSHWPLFEDAYAMLHSIPVSIDWGVPFVISFVSGIVFACVATWRRINDRWRLDATGNYLEHENFQEKDRMIAKGAKTFVAVFPCLIRRYLYFGFGNIEVRSSVDNRVIDRIEGVFFAKHHAEVIKSRFGTTDTTSVAQPVDASDTGGEVADDESF